MYNTFKTVPVTPVGRSIGLIQKQFRVRETFPRIFRKRQKIQHIKLKKCTRYKRVYVYKPQPGDVNF